MCRRGEAPTFVYIQPNFHNPTGYLLSGPRRRRLIELAVQVTASRLALRATESRSNGHSSSCRSMTSWWSRMNRTTFSRIFPRTGPHRCRWRSKPGPGATCSRSGVSRRSWPRGWSAATVLPCLLFRKSLTSGGLPQRMGWIQGEPELLHRAFQGAGVIRSGGALNPIGALIVAELLRDGFMAAHIQKLVRRRRLLPPPSVRASRSRLCFIRLESCAATSSRCARPSTLTYQAPATNLRRAAVCAAARILPVPPPPRPPPVRD